MKSTWIEGFLGYFPDYLGKEQPGNCWEGDPWTILKNKQKTSYSAQRRRMSRGQRHRGWRELRGFGEQLVGVAGTWRKGMQGRQGPGQDGLRSLDVFLGTWEQQKDFKQGCTRGRPFWLQWWNGVGQSWNWEGEWEQTLVIVNNRRY